LLTNIKSDAQPNTKPEALVKRLTVTAALILHITFPFTNSAFADDPKPVSIVDYMKALGQDSEFPNRKKVFLEHFPGEDYKGTAAQNTKLLEKLVSTKKLLVIPMPSDKVSGCADFYDHPEVSKYLSQAFSKNVVKACIVTGDKEPQNKIRKALQELYSEAKPKNGKTFTASEHKEIHDKAYGIAGCKEKSATIVGWYVVDTAEWPSEIIGIAIELFGKCKTSP
jgi:hypothetical protein